MQVCVIRPCELGQSEIALWHRWQLADERFENPFLSPEFAIAVDAVHPHVRVAVVNDMTGVGSFFAFEQRRFGTSKAVGQGLSDCQGLVSHGSYDWPIGELLRACKLSLWDFDHLIASQAPVAPHAATLHPSPIIDLSSGFEAYLQARRSASRGLVASTLRKARKMERESGPLRLDLDVTDRDALRTLMRWKSNQYRRTGAVDRLAVDWVVGLLDRLLVTRGGGLTGSLAMLYAEDVPVAGHFGLRCSSTLSYWFPAYDPEWERYSPGLYVLLRLAEVEASRGTRYIDLGRGDHAYKQRFRSWDKWVAEGWVGRGGLATSRRTVDAWSRGVRRCLVDTPLEPLVRSALRYAPHFRGDFN
jgi:CelD/BcsL family acetyltransferase involved in cellulose biosynthesis